MNAADLLEHRWILCLLVVVLGTALRGFDVIEAVHWLDLMKFVVGTFVAGSVLKAASSEIGVQLVAKHNSKST